MLLRALLERRSHAGRVRNVPVYLATTHPMTQSLLLFLLFAGGCITPASHSTASVGGGTPRARWVSVGTSSGYEIFLDTRSISGSGTIKTAWTRDRRKGSRLFENMEQLEVDCAEGRLRSVATAEVTETGRKGRTTVRLSPGMFSKPERGSPSETTVNLVCA